MRINLPILDSKDIPVYEDFSKEHKVIGKGKIEGDKLLIEITDPEWVNILNPSTQPGSYSIINEKINGE